MNTPDISLDQIKKAHERIKPFIHRTPVLTSETINAMAGAEIYFKCENLQKIGAFKIRGATNAVLLLSGEERKNGVATHSSGNHAQAIALAAKTNGIKAYIVMPETAPKVKVKAVEGYGAEIIFCASTQQAREETLQNTIDKTGATFIHPYDNDAVIAGQATAAVELLEQQPGLDLLMCPVGGGGLVSGTALAAHYLSPHTGVVAGEPQGADDAYQSLQAGKLFKKTNPQSLADGLLASISEKTFYYIQKYVGEIILVNEDEIVAAMQLVWERMKIIIEPSCAVPLAALLKEKGRMREKKIGIILTGGNVDLGKLPF